MLLVYYSSPFLSLEEEEKEEVFIPFLPFFCFPFAQYDILI